MADRDATPIEPGSRIRIIQQIPQRADVWVTRIEGVVVSRHQAMTGAWFAHARDGRLWLDRVEIRRDDGELVVCNLDQFSRVEVLESAAKREEAEDDVVADKA